MKKVSWGYDNSADWQMILKGVYDIVKKLKTLGISERTIQTVKKELGITSYRKNGVWLWHLSDDTDSSNWRFKDGE